MLALLPVAGIGLVIGFRHAFEPDHLAAVTAMAARQGSARGAARLGLLWGLGHTVAVGLVAGLLVALDLRLPVTLQAATELLVAALLVTLGVSLLVRHRRDAAPPARDGRRSFGFGVAHGIAGSGALAVLMVAAASTHAAQLVYFVTFGLGTIAGMLGVSAAVASSVRLAGERHRRWAARLQLGAAAASVVAGGLLAMTTIRLL